MFKRTLILLILFCSFQTLSAQDIRYFFKILPRSYTPEFSSKTKDSILQGKGYYPADNDSESIVVYKLERFDSVKNFLRIEMSFETGQRGFSIYELRSFKAKDGSPIVVFSNFSGAPHGADQNDLSVFLYTKANKLIRTSSHGLIPKISLKDFVKPNTPDSIIKEYNGYFIMNYELGNRGDNISIYMHCDIYLEEFHKWQLGDTIEFIWNGERFIRQKPKFDD
jgi:hypothetical protein